MGSQRDEIKRMASELGIDAGNSSSELDQMKKLAESVGMSDFNGLSNADTDELERRLKEKKRQQTNAATTGVDNGNQFKKAGNVARMSGGSGITSDDPEVQKQAAKDLAKKELKPIVVNAVKATPYGKPVPKKVVEKAYDKVAESEAADKVMDKVIEPLQKVQKKKKTIMFLWFLMPIISWFLIFLIIVIAIMIPVGLISEFLGSVGGFFASLGNWLIGNGWCANDAECQSLYESKYYEAIEDFENKYNGICSIEWNSELIAATIFYEQMMVMDEVGIDDDTEDEEELMESTGSFYNYKNANKKVNELTKRLYPNLDDVNKTSTERCQAAYNSYSSYLYNTYIDRNFKELKKPEYSEYTKEVIVEEIMAFGNEILIQNAYRGSYYCQGVTVLDQDDNIIGTYNLEDYVAGVVANEAYTEYGIEALKAQAIAARTFVLKQTDNCKEPIQSGQNKQVFGETTDAKAIQAALETEGLVLQYDSELINAQYDSYCYADSDCPDSTCNGTECSVTYTKLPNNEQHVVTIPVRWSNLFVPGFGHARGMSQLASYQMAEDGATADEILYTFYSPGVEIAAMSGLIHGTAYTSNAEPPLSADVIKQRVQNGDMFYNSSMGLVSQCPWYAKSRAAEIVYHSDMAEELKDAAISSIKNTGGNGGDIVNNMDEMIFAKSYDYTQPKPGALISWSSRASDGASCHNYGHVAVIEQVKEDGTILISDGWNTGGPNGRNVWSNIGYSLRQVSLEYLSGYTNRSGCRYTFNGYAYLLG